MSTQQQQVTWKKVDLELLDNTLETIKVGIVRTLERQGALLEKCPIVLNVKEIRACLNLKNKLGIP